MAEDDSIISLNVGGTLYTTHKSTLTRYPDSMLGAMFSGKFSVRNDTNGHCFIDRDGRLFRYILNYLRDGRLVLPTDFNELEQLRNEAAYYQIQPLKDDLKKRRVRISMDAMNEHIVSYLAGITSSVGDLQSRSHQNHAEVQKSLNSMAVGVGKTATAAETVVERLQLSLRIMQEIKQGVQLVVSRV